MRKHSLLTLAALTLAGAAQAADLPVRAVKIAPTSAGAAYGPFYIIGQAGAGASSSQNELTLPGLNVQGVSPKEWPTGFLLGTGVGIESGVTGIGKFQAELKANYDFTAASFGCSGIQAVAGIGCAGRMRNGFLFQEMLYWSPIAAPLSFTGWQWTQAVGLYGGIGAAERDLRVCLNNLDNTETCDTAWLTGFDAGAKVEVPVTTHVKLRLTYDWLHYDHQISHAASPVFTTSFTAQNEQLFLAGLDFHF